MGKKVAITGSMTLEGKNLVVELMQRGDIRVAAIDRGITWTCTINGQEPIDYIAIIDAINWAAGGVSQHHANSG